jgi:hypothetical protein
MLDGDALAVDTAQVRWIDSELKREQHDHSTFGWLLLMAHVGMFSSQTCWSKGNGAQGPYPHCSFCETWELKCGNTAQGVLILRPPDAALHAMVLLGLNAALALASGCAAKSDAVADLPWSPDIMLDDSVMQWGNDMFS